MYLEEDDDPLFRLLITERTQKPQNLLRGTADDASLKK